MSLYWYNWGKLRKAQGLNSYRGMEAWMSIHKAMPMIIGSRFSEIKPPIQIKTDHRLRIPDLDRSPLLTFEECCLARAADLLAKAERMDKPIYLMFSGGLDSTSVAISFLRTADKARLRDRIKIATTTQAWLENPAFVKKHLIPNFEFISSMRAAHFYDGRALVVNGDPSEFEPFPDRYLSALATCTPTVDIMLEFLTSHGLDGRSAHLWTEIFDEERRAAPIEILTFRDWLWWIRFVWTWQSTHFNGLSVLSAGAPGLNTIDEYHERVQPFYDSTAFQVWAMLGCKRREGKFYFREFIREFTKDDAWVDSKKKVNSLHYVLSKKKRTIGVDESFGLISEPNDLLLHFDPSNDFA
jgi:hypothetical protein